MIMKKFIWALVLLCVAPLTVMAAVNDNGIITINCSTEYSVEVSTTATFNAGDPGTTIAIGVVDTNLTCVAPKSFYIWNTSSAGKNTVQSYTLLHSGGSTWTYNDAAFSGGLNQMALGALFSATAPLPAAFVAGSTINLVTTVARAWSITTTPHYYDGTLSNQHYNPVPGTPTAVRLWPAIRTPSAVAASTAQSITITVAAGVPLP